MKTKKSLIIITIIILIALFFLIKLLFFNKKNESPPITQVMTSPPIERQIVPRIATVGSVVATQETHITPKSGGYISQILFTEGQFVKTNTPVILLDDTKIKAKVASDMTTYQISKKRYALYQKVFKKGLITKTEVETEHANMANQLANLTQDQTLLNEMTLRAPFDGYLGAKTVNLGDYVNAAQSLVLLVDRDHLQVEYSLPEKYASHLKLGMTVTINDQADPHTLHKATISYIAPNVDATSRTITVHATIQPTQQALLLPGQYVTVHQPLGAPTAALFIPEEAIVPTLNHHNVFIVDHGQAKSIPVTLGVHQNGRVEIKQGLEKTNQVIVSRQRKLKDGQAVEIKNQG